MKQTGGHNKLRDNIEQNRENWTRRLSSNVQQDHTEQLPLEATRRPVQPSNTFMGQSRVHKILYIS